MSDDERGRELVAGPDDAGRRVDRILRSVLGGRPLSSIYAALRKGLIKVNGSKASPELRLVEGDRIFLHDSLGKPGVLSPSKPSGAGDDSLESIADILLLATEDLLFINKPRGIVSQDSDELEGRIRRALSGRSASSLSFFPGPLHRLDRNTTGILAFPRSSAGARAFTALLRGRGLKKRYLALVDGDAPGPDEWRDRLARDGEAKRSFVSDAGDEAYASVTPILASVGRSLLLVELHTGLTHQIRAQASSRGMPLSGDSKYGGSPFPGGYILHALSLGFPDPPFPDLPRRVTAPLPPSAHERLAGLFGAVALRGALAELEAE